MRPCENWFPCNANILPKALNPLRYGNNNNSAGLVYTFLQKRKTLFYQISFSYIYTIINTIFGAPERLPAFGARTFPTVFTTSVVQDLNEKIAGIDCMMR
jgi:hypothetical protein